MESKAVINTKSKERGVLQSPELYNYIMDTSVYPREHECLKELRAITSTHPRAVMGTSPDVGQFLDLLLRTINAKKTIEIGVFTGYSLLQTALTIPDDGKITAIDVNRSSYEIGLPIIEKARVKHKINFIESEALPVLDELLKDAENKGSFDFAFVDADKDNYANYHQRMMELLKPGGIAIYDNTLWGGSVAMDEESSVRPRSKPARKDLIAFNKYIAGDARVKISQVPLGDGITVCRRN
ncbi:probable caffeoyl-CoA O-methyltransferase At4g26220 isoform X2 [Salvia hispanica]|uniref:probable caffeoyl-CoA O-methyltransferase At4g26220 isoform X2 n=1 Tax=Salvia hispanica TaxID=49212 RepID=UPI0020091925|nr:probable caffeoyl-CoA O-methyltransferase At4g26220 isoform X2 [Salvia hispanica]